MIYKVDYHGYIYEWTNSSNGKKYIGSHYGAVEDKYIGSGKAFKPAYNKNPHFFTITILEYVLENDKKLVLQKEQAWLDTVLNIRENKSYYNLNNFSMGGASHLTQEHVIKRSKTLKEKHVTHGLSEAELGSYKTKIQTRLDRIATTGFTEKEKEQHKKYGFQIQITLPTGEIKIYDSCSAATRELGIDVAYGLRVCITRNNFKGCIIVKLKDPITDCR